jgi:hypothetical protein
VTISGRGVPGSSVSVFDHGDAIGQPAIVDAQGRWAVEVDLPAGRHSITAQATLGNRQSRLSQPMFLIVDPTLPYNPLSMRFADPRGHRHRPVDEHGRTDDGGWRVRLRLDTTYQFGVQSNCAEPDAQFQLQIDGLPSVALGDVNGDGIYTGSFTTGDVRISAPFALVIFCGGVRYTSGGTMLWDPEGVVSDAANGQPLADATVTLLEQTEGGLRPWPAEEYGQSNPQTTGADGHYSFYTPPGVYVVEVRRAGYQTYRTEELVVVDEPAHRDIALTAEPVGQTTYMLVLDDSGFDSPVLRVRPGAVVEVINVDVWEHAIKSPRDSASGQATGRRSSGLLGAGGRFSVTIPPLDGTSKEASYFMIEDSTNGFNLAAIVVDSNAPPPGGYRAFLPLLRQ